MADRTVPEASISAGRGFRTSRLKSRLDRIEVRRDGRAEPLIETAPTLTSAQIGWAGIAVETHRISAGVIPRHEHPEHFLQVVLEGCVKYEVQAGGRRTRFVGTPGTVILQPRGAVDEIRWLGPVHTVAVAIHPTLLTQSLESTAHRNDIELRQSFDLKDRHIAVDPEHHDARLGRGFSGRPTLRRVLGRLVGRILGFPSFSWKSTGCFCSRRTAGIPPQAGNGLHRREFGRRLELGSTCDHCWHEPPLLLGDVPAEYRPLTLPIRAFAKNRARETEAPHPRLQRINCRRGGRVCQSQPLRAHLPTDRWNLAVEVSGRRHGLTPGEPSGLNGRRRLTTFAGNQHQARMAGLQVGPGTCTFSGRSRLDAAPGQPSMRVHTQRSTSHKIAETICRRTVKICAHALIAPLRSARCRDGAPYKLLPVPLER